MGATAAITPSGVRDGERTTLRALSERRGAAVLAFSEQVCAPGHALDAAVEAFAHFRAAVVAATSLHEIDAEALLLSATREAGARHAPMPPPSGRFAWGARTRRSCSLVPELLAARADGGLAHADVRRLERHLGRCAGCHEVERRWHAAEVAYRTDSLDAPAALAIEAIERALRAAAPAAPGAPHPDHVLRADLQAATPPVRPWHGSPLDVAEPPELPASLTSALNASSAPGNARGSAHGADAPLGPVDQSRWAVADAAAAQESRHPAGPPREWPGSSPPPLADDVDPDATMAWALEAPDFDGDIVAVDLRERPAVPAAPPVGLDADTGPPAPTRRIRRLLLPLVLGLVVILVALALVGSLAGSPVHRTPAPAPGPTAIPGNTSSSGATAPVHHRRGGRHRGGGRAHAPAKAGARSLSPALSAVPAAVRATAAPGLNSSHSPSPGPAPTAEAKRPTAAPKQPSTATTPTTGAGSTSSPPPAAARPRAIGPTSAPSSGSPPSGGTAAPAP